MSQYPTISSKAIIAKAYADLNVQENKRWEVWMEWIAEALEHIGAHTQYIIKEPIEIQIENYRGILPCDLVNVISVVREGYTLNYGLGTNDYSGDKSFRKSSNFYTLSYPYINVGFKEGKVEMIYQAVPLDNEGFPLIPDRISLKEACFRYIVKQEMYPKLLSGDINPNLYLKLEQDWFRYCAQARGDLNFPNADKQESIKNQWLRLVPAVHAHTFHHSTANQSERVI